MTPAVVRLVSLPPKYSAAVACEPVRRAVEGTVISKEGHIYVIATDAAFSQKPPRKQRRNWLIFRREGPAAFSFPKPLGFGR
jgi:hypothetical protein